MPAKRARRLARVASCSGEVQEVQQRAVREIIELQEKLLADGSNWKAWQPRNPSLCHDAAHQLRIEKLETSRRPVETARTR